MASSGGHEAHDDQAWIDSLPNEILHNVIQQLFDEEGWKAMRLRHVNKIRCLRSECLVPIAKGNTTYTEDGSRHADQIRPVEVRAKEKSRYIDMRPIFKAMHNASNYIITHYPDVEKARVFECLAALVAKSMLYWHLLEEVFLRDSDKEPIGDVKEHALLAAISLKRLDIVQELFRAGVQPTQASVYFGEALATAVWSDAIDIVQEHLERLPQTMEADVRLIHAAEAAIKAGNIQLLEMTLSTRESKMSRGNRTEAQRKIRSVLQTSLRGHRDFRYPERMSRRDETTLPIRFMNCAIIAREQNIAQYLLPHLRLASIPTKQEQDMLRDAIRVSSIEIFIVLFASLGSRVTCEQRMDMITLACYHGRLDVLKVCCDKWQPTRRSTRRSTRRFIQRSIQRSMAQFQKALFWAGRKADIQLLDYILNLFEDATYAIILALSGAISRRAPRAIYFLLKRANVSLTRDKTPTGIIEAVALMATTIRTRTKAGRLIKKLSNPLASSRELLAAPPDVFQFQIESGVELDFDRNWGGVLEASTENMQILRDAGNGRIANRVFTAGRFYGERDSDWLQQLPAAAVTANMADSALLHEYIEIGFDITTMGRLFEVSGRRHSADLIKRTIDGSRTAAQKLEIVDFLARLGYHSNDERVQRALAIWRRP